MHHTAYWRRIALLLLLLPATGCAILPEQAHQPQFHNPFPQLTRVAVLPFSNQSTEATLDGSMVGNLYRNELQQIPGFEVMPMGVVETKLRGIVAANSSAANYNEATNFQTIAQQLGVDAVVVGAITDFDEYYPPRIGLSVSWYAANPSFHPIPAGYGLPFGTAEEEYIPESLVFEAEHAFAREQLKTQEPALPGAPETPQDWPDPSGLHPGELCEVRPSPLPQAEPIIRHMRQYHGNDTGFTLALENYYSFREEARFGGWESYLQRKEDFIRFCCYLNITEMLAARGGAGKTQVVWRWPDDR